MTLLAYLFVVALGGLILVRRGMRLNVWWVAFISTAIYSLPVAFGIDIFGKDLTEDAMLMMLLTLSTTFICALLLDRRRRSVESEDRLVSRDKMIVYLLVLFGWAVFAVVIAAYGWQIFFIHKIESGVSGVAYMLWRLSSSFGFLACLLIGRRRLALVAAVPLAATLFAGDRTAVGLTTVACAWWLLRDMHGVREVVKIAIPVCLIGLFVFFGKIFQGQWVTGQFESVYGFVRSVVAQGVVAIITAEPFVVAGVLSSLTTLRVSPSDFLVLELAAQLLGVPSWFGFHSSSFNDFFQPILFPWARERSLAYSFWGEGFVRGGWFGYVGFLVVYLGGLSVFQRMSESSSFILRLFAFYGGAYWAFYIHRNSLVSIVAYERQAVIYLCFAFIIAFVYRAWRRGVRGRQLG